MHKQRKLSCYFDEYGKKITKRNLLDNINVPLVKTGYIRLLCKNNNIPFVKISQFLDLHRNTCWESDQTWCYFNTEHSKKLNSLLSKGISHFVDFFNKQKTEITLPQKERSLQELLNIAENTTKEIKRILESK